MARQSSALGCWRGGRPGTTRGKGDAGLEQRHRQLHPVGCIGDLQTGGHDGVSSERSSREKRGGTGSGGMTWLLLLLAGVAPGARDRRGEDGAPLG